MTYLGKISDGKVIFPPGVALPEGMAVEVKPVAETPMAPTAVAEEDGPTLYEMFEEFVGALEGPSDLAENHDHYAHGAPKRSAR